MSVMQEKGREVDQLQTKLDGRSSELLSAEQMKDYLQRQLTDTEVSNTQAGRNKTNVSTAGYRCCQLMSIDFILLV